MSAQQPVFYYGFVSPYSYLAACRIDEVLPVRAQWRPISFGVIVQRIGKVPWSFKDDRRADLQEIARRAFDRGLPAIRYPEGWPRQNYSLVPLRAAMLARDQDQLRAITLELFRTLFVQGRHLADVEAVLDAAERAGMQREAVREGIGAQEVKDRARAQTDEAYEQGVKGVPTIEVGGELFWGDDRLEDAAAALAG